VADGPEPPLDEPDGESGRLGGLLGKAGAVTGRLTLASARAVARQGKDALTDEAERAIDGVMAGPLPEAVGRSIVEHHVIERVLTEAMEAKSAELGLDTDGGEGREGDEQQLDPAAEGALNPALERTLTNLVDSRMTKEFVDHVVQSEAFRGALKQVLSSDEVRGALMHQTTTFAGEIADGVRTRAQRVDDSLAVRRGQEPGRYGGLATRGTALVIDILLAHLVFLAAGATIGIIAGLVGTLRPEWVVGLVVGFGWLIVLVAYFVLFWSSVGQTPGMRLFRLRVVHGEGAPPVWRSVVRLVGLALAIIPCFAGFVPVLFDSRRRALQDYLAGTVVVHEP
jgi:uncharacterized RDD family membrane protein YckC